MYDSCDDLGFYHNETHILEQLLERKYAFYVYTHAFGMFLALYAVNNSEGGPR